MMSRTLILGAMVAPLVGSTVHAQLFEIDRIAELGDPVPGLDSIVFEAFGVHPNASSLGISGSPGSLDHDGNAAFHAFIGAGDGLSPVLHDNRSALFKNVDGVITLVIETAGDAPGVDEDFVGPGFAPPTPHLHEGLVSFQHFAGGTPFFPGENGVWGEDGSGVALRAHEVLGLPDAGGIDLVGLSASFRDGTVIVSGGNTANDFAGLWREAGAGISTVTFTGQPAPSIGADRRVGRFEVGQFINKFIVALCLNDAGHVAADSYISAVTGDFDRRSDEALWLERGAGIEPLIVEGQPVCEGFGEPGFFQSGIDAGFIRDVELNNNDRVAFLGFVEKPSGQDVLTVWTDRNGAFELIARNDRFVPAPGVDGRIFSLTFLEFNDRGDVAIRMVVDTDLIDDEPQDDVRVGVWVDRGEGLELVAVEEGPVPGHPGIFFPVGNQLRGVDRMTLLEDGTVVFTGFFFDDAGDLREGVFRMNPDGTREEIFSTGDRLLIDGSTDRRLREFDLFIESPVSDAGEMIVAMEFLDGTSGLYRVPLTARSAGCPGDCDGSGVVDFNDLVSMLFEFGETDQSACDADSTGDVDFNDLVAALFLFGACP